MTSRQLAASAVAAAVGVAVVAFSLAGRLDLAAAAVGLLLSGLTIVLLDVRRRQGDMARRLKLIAQRQKVDSNRVRGLPQEIKAASRRSFGVVNEAVDAALGRVEAAGEGVLASVAQERLAAAERHVELNRLIDDIGAGVAGVRVGVDASAADVSAARDDVLRVLGELEQENRRRQVALREHLGRLEYEPVRQVQALLQLLEQVEPRAPLPPAGGWAVEPSTLLRLVRLVADTRPSLVVECGSGTSTVWLAYAVQALGAGRVVALEHDERFAERTKQLLDEHGLDSVAEVRLAPLSELKLGDEVFLWYDLAAVDDLDQIDVLLVDGPPQASGSRARYPALPVLGSKLANGARVVFDDADRPAEREAVETWLAENPSLKRDGIEGERSAFLVYRSQ